jgi:hypothetical protein
VRLSFLSPFTDLLLTLSAGRGAKGTPEAHREGTSAKPTSR